MEISTEANKKAHSILERERGRIKGKGIAVIDLDSGKVIDVVKESAAVDLFKRLSKDYKKKRIYLLSTDTKSPVVWSR